MKFLDAIQQQVILIDGAMGTMIQELDVTDADFGGPNFRMLGDLLTFSRPGDIENIHLEYFRAGANAVETNTFGASPLRLSEYDFTTIDLASFADLPDGLDPKTAGFDALAYALNRQSAEIACRARDRYRQEDDYDSRPLFIIGSIGPSNRVLSKTDASLQESNFDEIADNSYQQVLGLIDGGADVLLYETQQDILETKAAVIGGRRALSERNVVLPIMAQVTVDEHSKMQIFNTDIHAALVTLEGIGIDTFGINCSIGPDLMTRTVETIARYSHLPISVVPNAGLPVSEHGRTVYKFTPDMLAGHLKRFVQEFGVNIVGGCCGTGPDHTRALARAIHGLTPAIRSPKKELYISGPQEAILLDSSEALILVGERLNARGSIKVRDAVESGDKIDHNILEEVVHEQIDDLGLTVIDVCMDSNLVDTTEALTEVIHEQTADFAGAMSIDSFGIDTLREAIKVYPGRPIINSFSLEEVEPGVTKIDAVVKATNEHDPVYIALTAGPEGPAATRQDKARLAAEIVQNAGRHGVGPERIFIDMNVFPLGAESEPGMNFALESLQAIPLIKKIHPDLHTICGVGNLTNGLAKKPYMRKVLTSVWLDEAKKLGLDAAIVNPNHYVFVENLDQADYKLARQAILEHDMDAFEELERIAEQKRGDAPVKRSSYEDLSIEDAICQKIIDGFKERENGSLDLNGHTYAYLDRIALQTAEIIHRHEPLEFINKYLMSAMKTLGDQFGKGEVSLPHLLKSADVMKQVMGFLEEYMHVQSGVDIHDKIKYKGTIVIGTVFQDVHSIGKDLAKTLFENYGYRVIDLGVMTPLQKYLDTAKEYNADAIGMSALLVQTSNHMITVSKMMQEQDLADTTILIGGAPVNDRHAAYVALAGQDDPQQMRENVFYCATAMEGVNVMNELGAGADTKLRETNRKKLQARYERAQRRSREDEDLLQSLPRREIDFSDYVLPEKPCFEPELVRIPLIDFRDRIDKRTLFSLNWRFGGKTAREKHGTSTEELEQLFLEWTEKAHTNGWIQPQGIIAVFPCNSEGDDLVLFDLQRTDLQRTRFDFDRVIGAGREDTVCAAQYFRTRASGILDAVGIQISSTGPQIDRQLDHFKQSGDSEAALMLQGLSDRIAEDLAEHLHGILRSRMGLEETNVGTRWSPGYPAIANTANNAKIHQLIDAQLRIGVSITDAGEFQPTGTTAAIVSFHPLAKYS